MNTADLQALTLAAAHRMKGKPWPNRLGFDCRGWEFLFVEATGKWTARRHNPSVAMYWGWGDSPEAARTHARQRQRERGRG